MVKNKDGIVVLVFVTPFGMAEQVLIDEITRLHKERYKDLRYAVALEALFGWRNRCGKPVNRYSIEHEDLVVVRDVKNDIEKAMHNAQIREDFPKEEAIPEVIFARAKPFEN